MLRASTHALSQTRALRRSTARMTPTSGVSFTLPNKTTYTKIVISDVFENVQSVDIAAMEVLDADGNNVAAKGTFKVADTSDTQKTITWTASDAYLGELNAKYGPNSDVHPTLTLEFLPQSRAYPLSTGATRRLTRTSSSRTRLRLRSETTAESRSTTRSTPTCPR